MVLAILNIIISLVALVCIGLFFYLMGKMTYHFFPMIKYIKDSKYYVLGPLILFSDSYFLNGGVKHRRFFVQYTKRLFIVVIIMILVAVYMSVMKDQ